MSTERNRIALILEAVRRIPTAGTHGLPITTDLFGLDDCAVVSLGDVGDLVLGSDFVRGPGFFLFKLGVLTWFDIGYYLVGANVSDLAAMGATPIGILTVVRYEGSVSDGEFAEVAKGIAAACRDCETPLLGGDTGSYECSVLSAAAVGICPPKGALLRSAGRAGDYVYLTGSVGLAGAALAYYTRARPAGFLLSADEEELLASAWRRVTPAIPQGKLLSAQKLATCAIDTSDGLRASCRQLAEASDVDIVIDPDAVPIPPVVRKVAEFLGVDSFAFGLSDSVDFRVLFGGPPATAELLEGQFASRGFELHRIGEMKPKSANTGRALWSNDGVLDVLPGVEWAQGSELSIDTLRQSSSRT